MTDLNPMLKAALEFYAAGCSVVPAKIDGTKAPIGEWKKYQSERATAEQVIAWYSNGYEGLGIVTGAISGNLEVLEIEGRAVQADIHIEARQIAEASGLGDLWSKINNGYVEQSAGGGIHWLYRVEGMELPGNTKLARRPGENGGVDVLAETRSSGGYIITAPSHGGTHPKGTAWEMIAGNASSIPTITASEREALHDIFKIFDEMPERAIVAEQIKPRTDGVLTPGDDYNQRTTWDSILIPLGWKKAYTQGEKTAWTRPGKDFGVSATTNYQGTDKFRVFSTSTIFEAERSYDKFGAYALIHHNGDFKTAASDLRNKGYGPQGLNSFDLSNTPTTPNQLPKIAPTLTVEQSKSVANSLEPNYEESSWKPVELSDYYDGLFQTPIATILKRTDGAGLIYQGRVHSFYGESESGKSWLAQIATAECLKSDKKVIYIDFESDASDVIGRMKSLGVSRANALQYLTYIRPEGARDANDPYWKEILQPDSAALVVIDGVTESLTMWGGETKDNDKITQWMRIFPRTVATASGAAVVLIDHITKNAETRGRFAIGGQAKLATIDGAAFLVEPIEGLAPGKIGRLTVRVTKDRPGFVRKSAGMYRKSDRTQEAAVIVIDSTKAQMGYIIQPPTDEDDLKENIEIGKRREIVEFVHNHGGCSRRDINRGVKGDDGLKKDRTDDLIDEGFIINKGTGKNFILYVTDLAKSEFGLFDAEVTQIGGA